MKKGIFWRREHIDDEYRCIGLGSKSVLKNDHRTRDGARGMACGGSDPVSSGCKDSFREPNTRARRWDIQEFQPDVRRGEGGWCCGDGDHDVSLPPHNGVES